MTTSAKAPISQASAAAQVQQIGWLGTQQRDQPAERDLVFAMEQIEGQAQSRLQPGDAIGRALELLLLLMGRMGSVIGSDAIDGAVEQPFQHGAAVGFGAQGRIHLGIGVVLADRVLGQHEMMRRHLAGDVQAIAPGAANRVQRRRGR